MRKIILRASIILGGGLIALLLAAAIFLYFIFSPSRDEVARIKSPSGKFVATLVEVNGGATTSFGYDVYIARTGLNFGSTEVASLYGAIRSKSAYGVNLRWVSDKELHIEYLTAQSAEVLTPSFRAVSPSVRVVLRPGTIGPATPPGGMLYNLQGRPSVGG